MDVHRTAGGAGTCKRGRDFKKIITMGWQGVVAKSTLKLPLVVRVHDSS